MRLMIIGPQGVGKGTQSVLLSRAVGVPHISTGDLFRSHASAQTELGRRAQEYMDAGELVPDAVTNAMVAERLSFDDTANGYLLDGFPRTLDQARWFSQTLGPERDLQAVILLEAPLEELVAAHAGTRPRRRPARDHPPPPGAVPDDHPAAPGPLRQPAHPDQRHRCRGRRAQPDHRRPHRKGRSSAHRHR